MKIGRYEGELKRVKIRARLQNNIISNTREANNELMENENEEGEE
jgi:hypothetical protein